jgi:hypothetical protein
MNVLLIVFEAQAPAVITCSDKDRLPSAVMPAAAWLTLP